MRPNVVCVVLDSLRADALEPYGAAPGSSPAIAELARRGSALPLVHSAASWTLPAHASMLTGELPRTLGLTQAPAQLPQSARPVIEANRDRLLPEVLRRAGYSTAAVSANLWFSSLAGFDTGFERFVDIEALRQVKLADPSRRARLAWVADALLARTDDGAGQALEVLRDWLDERARQGSSRPFFWMVNLIECHSPCLPPRPYNDLSAAERLRAAAESRRHMTLQEIWRICVTDLELPRAAAERWRRLYAAAVRMLDDWVGRLLEGLERGRALDDTLVVVTADHGENLGEGGLVSHAFSLDQRLIHVPFVAAGPGAPRDEQVRSLTALPRLVAEAAGLQDHPWTADRVPRGLGIAQFDPLADRSDPRNRRAIDIWGLDDAGFERLTTPLTAVTDGRFKLLRTDSGDVFFDLDRDPLELDPRSPSEMPAGELARLLPALEESAPAEPPRPARAADPAELAEIEDRMRLLGYL